MSDQHQPRPHLPPEETPSPSPDRPRPDYGRHNVLAVLPDMDTARDAIEALEHAGVEANAISLLGRKAEAVAEPTRERQRAGDTGVATTAGRGAGKGAAIGAGVGGAAGFFAGAVAFGIPGVGPAIGAGIWAATLGGAAAGAGVGFTAGGIAGVKESEAWSLTYKSVREGKVVLGVHGDDPEMVGRAAEILSGSDPERLEEFDVEGARRL